MASLTPQEISSVPKFLQVTIYSQEEVVYQGVANSVSSYSDEGIFDVLPQHTNFIAIIQKEVNVVATDGQKIHYEAPKSIMRVAANVVEVFLGFT